MPQKWYVYILECSDETYYTGITTNLRRRLDEHNEGDGARYTRSRLPVKMTYIEPCKNRSHALEREHRLRSLTRAEKEEMIRNQILPYDDFTLHLDPS